MGEPVEKRVKVASRLKPELASLNAGSLNFALFHVLDKIKDWKHDWENACKISESLVPDSRKRSMMLEELIRRLHRLVESDSCWPAIAALADELAAHEFLDQDQIEQTIGFWFRQSA